MPTAVQVEKTTMRHSAVVRATHWITFVAAAALLITGIEIIISHPRFYWGEVGNVNTPALFALHIPSSRGAVPTGYGYVMPDQNGWSRALHFEAAWVLVVTGLVYLLNGLWTRHFRRNLLPEGRDRSWRAYRASLASMLRPKSADDRSYNLLQRTTYLLVIFGLFPMLIWTGLAMSPAFTGALPASVELLGGRQSARTLHFFLSGFFVLFLFTHVAMVALSGFGTRTRAMITGRSTASEDRP